MTLIIQVVGLEAKRELDLGELRERSRLAGSCVRHESAAVLVLAPRARAPDEPLIKQGYRATGLRSSGLRAPGLAVGARARVPASSPSTASTARTARRSGH
jgi:hypothetical protein